MYIHTVRYVDNEHTTTNERKLIASRFTVFRNYRRRSKHGHYFARRSRGDEHVCVCVCLSVCMQAYLRHHTRHLNFSVHVARGRGLVLLRQGDEIQGKGAICPGHSKALAIFVAAFAAKGIIQSPVMSCSRRNHSLCQASTDRNPDNSECRRCGLSAGKG